MTCPPSYIIILFSKNTYRPVELRVQGVEWQETDADYCAALSTCALPYGIANYALLAVAHGPAKRPSGDAPLNLRVHPMHFSHESGKDI